MTRLRRKPTRQTRTRGKWADWPRLAVPADWDRLVLLTRWQPHEWKVRAENMTRVEDGRVTNEKQVGTMGVGASGEVMLLLVLGG